MKRKSTYRMIIGRYDPPRVSSIESRFKDTQYDDFQARLAAAQSAMTAALNAPKVITKSAEQYQAENQRLAKLGMTQSQIERMNPQTITNKEYYANLDAATKNYQGIQKDEWTNRKSHDAAYEHYIIENVITPLHDRQMAQPDQGSWLNEIKADDPTRYATLTPGGEVWNNLIKTDNTITKLKPNADGSVYNPEFGMNSSVKRNYIAAKSEQSKGLTFDENVADNVQMVAVKDRFGRLTGGYVYNPNYRSASQRTTDHDLKTTQKASEETQKDIDEIRKIDPTYKKTAGSTYADATRNRMEEQMRRNADGTYQLLNPNSPSTYVTGTKVIGKTLPGNVVMNANGLLFNPDTGAQIQGGDLDTKIRIADKNAPSGYQEVYLPPGRTDAEQAAINIQLWGTAFPTAEDQKRVFDPSEFNPYILDTGLSNPVRSNTNIGILGKGKNQELANQFLLLTGNDIPDYNYGWVSLYGDTKLNPNNSARNAQSENENYNRIPSSDTPKQIVTSIKPLSPIYTDLYIPYWQRKKDTAIVFGKQLKDNGFIQPKKKKNDGWDEIIGSFGKKKKIPRKVNKGDTPKEILFSKKTPKSTKVYKANEDKLIDEILHGMPQKKSSKKPVKKFDYKNCGI